MSLISRKLLTPDEVLRIESPYILLMIAGKPPAILYVPDISKMHFNKLNGMGTKEENQKLRIKREKQRETRKISKIKIWDIWNKYQNRQDEFYGIDQIRYNLGVMKRKEKLENEEGTNQEDM